MKNILATALLLSASLFTSCATQGIDFTEGVSPYQEVDPVLSERQQIREQIRAITFESSHPIERLEELFVKRNQILLQKQQGNNAH